MCFGYLGIQFGFSLQNANVSRIFETLGADYANMAILFVAAPITGLIVQPIIGYLSDNTWNRFGRRSPYFLAGAIAATIALFIMPNSPVLWIAVGMLWIMDASINVCMEPTRAFVGDMLPKQQRPMGYAMQTFFIGVASVVASALPWMMTNWFAVDNTAAEGSIPDSVKYSFYFGATILMAAVLWTFFTTKEYTPKELQQFADAEPKADQISSSNFPARANKAYLRGGLFWIISGAALTLIISLNLHWLDIGLYILSGGAIAFGICQLWVYLLTQRQVSNGFTQIIQDLFAMPPAMQQLAVVQFFSWFPFFAMWTYMTAAVTSHHFGSSDPVSELYNQGANWAGILNSIYNATTIFAALLIPVLVRRLGLRLTHMLNLMLGGAGFISFMFIENPQWLTVSMIGVGFAWASILGMPYVIISNVIPFNKMGVFMGISNLFIVLPQILAASILGLLVSRVFDNAPIYTLVTGGVSMVIAALLTYRLKTT
jgi:maltose/moltooligosaccharide transporter